MPISQTEAETRAQLIDKALEKAEWKLHDPRQIDFLFDIQSQKAIR